ncbi:M57 family metalloprotease, partial [Winogradskyella sp.]
MKKPLKYLAFAISVFALVFTACEKDESIDDTSNFQEDMIINMNDLNNRTLVTDPDMLEAIAALDIDAGIVSRGDFHLPDGTIEERIYIGSDITFTFEELNALIEGCEGCRQYSTYNLVEGSYRTIDILGYTGGSQALSSKAQTALQWAVDNYNNLSTTLQFNLTYGTNHQAADMVVYDNSVNNPGGTGGVAGFPNS